MAKFTYNNAKNTNSNYTLFELNYGYHPCGFFEKDTNSRFQLKTVEKLLAELQKLMIVC